jgi:hypothetical protein
MRKLSGVFVAAAVALVLAGCTAPAPSATPTPDSSGGPAAATSEVFTPVLGRVLAAPQAYPVTDGTVHLAYELLLSNALSQSITLDAVAVVADGETLLELGGEELAPWVRIYGGDPGSVVMGPGQQALVWLDVVVPTMADVPASLSHEVSIAPEEAIPPLVDTAMVEQIATTEVIAKDPVVVGAPLKGERWLDGNSCCDVTPHRAAVNPINGALHVPERYAIDFVQLTEDDRVYDGPVDELSSYAYEGSEILAVGDGPVVSMVWDLPEQTPGANPSGLAVEEYGGNHIVQDLGNGVYAFYAHLQPDNPKGLEVGQQLKKGETIALLGNSGNTDAPHLHFHLMDSPLPLASNGVAFAFEDFELQGTVAKDDIYKCAADGSPCSVEETDAGPQKAVGPIWGDLIAFE